MSMKPHCSTAGAFGESQHTEINDVVGTVATLAPERSGLSERSGTAEPNGSALFNLNRVKDCDKGSSDGPPPEPSILHKPYKIVRCKCRCRFCSDCALGLGLQLKEKLIPTIAKWSNMVMVTLTINPKRFASPEAAYRHVTKNRLISRWVRELNRRGVLKSRKFFSVFECQKNGNPHWHLLLEAPFVPHDIALQVWNQLGPDNELSTNENPSMGFVWFSAPKFKTPEHAANYACKYIIKPPIEGWPEWVLDYVGQVRRVSRSHGLFDHLKEPEPTPEYSHCNTCFCESCREQTQPKYCCECSACEEARQAIEERPEFEKPPKKVRRRRTVRERLENCGNSTVVLRRLAIELRPGHHKCKFITALEVPFNEACLKLGQVQSSQLYLNQKELDQLFSDDRMRNRKEENFEWKP